MDELIKIETKTMDSREIAELTGKRHDHVIRDIEEQLGKLNLSLPKFGDTYKNKQNGQVYRCYKLPYRETMILISGYSVELRAKVIDRWMELEMNVVEEKQKLPPASTIRELRMSAKNGLITKNQFQKMIGAPADNQIEAQAPSGLSKQAYAVEMKVREKALCKAIAERMTPGLF
jgi:anti-repressor protein